MNLMVLYDIRSDKVRRRVADACLDFGLRRIQYSAFLGRIRPHWRDEFEERLAKIIGQQPGQIYVLPIPKDALKKMEKIGPGLAKAS